MPESVAPVTNHIITAGSVTNAQLAKNIGTEAVAINAHAGRRCIPPVRDNVAEVAEGIGIVADVTNAKRITAPKPSVLEG